MDKSEIEEKHRLEKDMRDLFNEQNDYHAKKHSLHLGSMNATHEFDLFEEGKVVGGITTSPWYNRTGSNNTGGQDRVAAELCHLDMIAEYLNNL